MTGELGIGRTALARRGGTVVLAVLCLALTVVLGCSSHHPKLENMNEREYAPYRNPGTATISGQVTLTLASGTVLDGAACQVRLTPVTTMSTRHMQDVMGGSTKEWDDEENAVWWLTTADDLGRFKFERVPTGSYYITCPVAWRDPGSNDTRQRVLWAEATVGPEESVTVSVSR